jgi:hypothetical protein
VLTIAVTVLHVGISYAQNDREADRLIKTTKTLEEKPLDKDAKNIRSWALTWVIQTDKVSVTVCSLLISGIDKKYKYSGEVFGQYTLGMAAFKLGNPEKANEENTVQLAGIESALRSYEAMLKEQPKAKNAFLDELLAKRADDSLAKHVAENNCKPKS